MKAIGRLRLCHGIGTGIKFKSVWSFRLGFPRFVYTVSTVILPLHAQLRPGQFLGTVSVHIHLAEIKLLALAVADGTHTDHVLPRLIFGCPCLTFRCHIDGQLMVLIKPIRQSKTVAYQCAVHIVGPVRIDIRQVIYYILKEGTLLTDLVAKCRFPIRIMPDGKLGCDPV